MILGDLQAKLLGPNSAAIHRLVDRSSGHQGPPSRLWQPATAEKMRDGRPMA